MNIYLARKEFQKKLNGIPKKNKEKFFIKLMDLIDDAYKEDF